MYEPDPKNEREDDKPNVDKERHDNDWHRNEQIHHEYELKEKEKERAANGED